MVELAAAAVGKRNGDHCVDSGGDGAGTTGADARKRSEAAAHGGGRRSRPAGAPASGSAAATGGRASGAATNQRRMVRVDMSHTRPAIARGPPLASTGNGRAG
ncbi:Hypothetical protein I596_3207 [Dokdonella koreensis DS-123]|uniref:Uncharacterized protein n=1 Tax=Dokdonella koreensis DS-123 TaxID=1300342 RepID=A0A167H6P6_9GAMM|nr:Hypothetical protein I596_3207 [Dokdonella koreensis DS-123]